MLGNRGALLTTESSAAFPSAEDPSPDSPHSKSKHSEVQIYTLLVVGQLKLQTASLVKFKHLRRRRWLIPAQRLERSDNPGGNKQIRNNPERVRLGRTLSGFSGISVLVPGLKQPGAGISQRLRRRSLAFKEIS